MTQPRVLKNGSFEPIETGMAHIISVLSETWPCKAWMALRFYGERWYISHLHDEHYGLHKGDVWVLPENEVLPLDDGVHKHSIPIETQFLCGQQRINVSPIQGHIFHRVVCQDGDTYGAIVGLTSGELITDAQRSIPIISLMAELVMQTHSICHVASENDRRFFVAEMESQTDALTGLFNRRGWDRRVESILSSLQRRHRDMQVLILDVDNMKLINDTLGHAKGDELLKDLSGAIRNHVRETDIVARIGGDEFAILACDTDFASGQSMISNIQNALIEHGMSCSIGMETVTDPAQWQESVERADQLMYEQKRLGTTRN